MRNRAIFIVLIMGGVCCAAPVLGARPRTMSVQVRTTQLRGTASFLGRVVAQLSYGERVRVFSEAGAWMQVGRRDAPEGWVHASALTRKQIKFEAGREDARVAASSDELALAGKGFNSDVEAEFKAKNKNMNFTWIDWMEKVVISEQEMRAFLKTGELQPREGGAK